MISLNSTDIVARIRRFTKTVGKLSPTMPEQMQGTLSLLDLSRDPYQSEFKSFATAAINGGVAADLTCIGLQGQAPATVVLGADIILPAAGQVKLQVQRPGVNAGVVAGAAGLNGGGQTFVNQVVLPLARLLSLNVAGGETGPTVELINVPSTASYIWTPPVPVVLYGPPFNGQPAGAFAGDTFYVTNLTVAGAMTVTFYWLEYPNIQPN